MAGMGLKKPEVLDLLFGSDVSIEVCYAGLRHLATRCGREQRFQEAVHGRTAQVSGVHGEWIETLDLHDVQDLLQALHAHVAAECRATERRFAEAVGAALLTLERGLDSRQMNVHGNEVELPSEAPFDGARYRLLAPRASPFEDWAKKLELEIPRKAGDAQVDFAAALDLRWSLFPVDPNPLGVTVSFHDLPPRVASPLRARVDNRRLTIGAAAPLRGLTYEFQSYPDERHPDDGTPYRFKGLSDEGEDAKRDIERLLGRCTEAEVDILVYPELTLDPELLGHLTDYLEYRHEGDWPTLVIAGSFHEPAARAGSFVNRARAFDRLGQEIFQHDKLVRFRLTSHDLQTMSPETRQHLCASMGLDESGGFERIEQGDHVRVVDGPLGRMITSICLDFCGGSLDAVAKHGRCNVFWVPTMSPSLDEFRTKARFFSRESRAMTLVANSEWLLEAIGLPEGEARDALRSFCQLPMRGQAPPVAEDGATPGLRLFRIDEIVADLQDQANRRSS